MARDGDGDDDDADKLPSVDHLTTALLTRARGKKDIDFQKYIIFKDVSNRFKT